MNQFLSLSAHLNEFSIKDLGNLCFKNIEEALNRLKNLDERVSGCMIIQKCNCTEIYVVSKSFIDENFIRLVINFWKINSINFSSEYERLIRIRLNEDAVKHLFETSLGLKSVTIGDFQVYGQVNKAFRLSKSLGVSGIFLENLQSQIKDLSKVVEESTKFRRGKTSVPGIVSDIIKNHYDPDKNILIVGSGKMGSLLVQILTEMKYKITIISRNEKEVHELSKKYKCKFYKLKDLFKILNKSDIVILATDTMSLINLDNYRDILNRDIKFIDIGNPPNIDSKLAGKLKLINLDFIKNYSKNVHNKRLGEIPKVNRLINDKLISLKIFT